MKTLNRPYRVNEAVVRGIALQVLFLSLLTLFTGSLIPAFLLAGDFAIRVFLIPRFSPLAYISGKIIAPLARFKRKQIVFKPKRFAAMIGLSLSAASVVFLLNQASGPALFLLGMLALFSFLEAVFRFCAGCRIFGLLMKLGLVKEEQCPDCVFLDGTGI
ncbi:DUF4395 domain-containing protein [Spirochaeta isovalerica]|uniref:DUF4395 domain-containing protein n=1 Tax=Spirochaeta isovalerica TaxID=150 RepID=A0A841R8I5_9SPIO|nr:DUF4395 domain-containing protein [Spirochaeta isovalerica]MBB6480203.1 hypothetical protein [Spirochaeta isovalerica]